MKDDGNNRERGAAERAKDKRKQRLELALRENLRRRKSQARARDDFTQASSASDGVVHDDDRKGPAK